MLEAFMKVGKKAGSSTNQSSNKSEESRREVRKNTEAEKLSVVVEVTAPSIRSVELGEGCFFGKLSWSDHPMLSLLFSFSPPQLSRQYENRSMPNCDSADPFPGRNAIEPEGSEK
ncbi:hypothetical protein AKJ16_DCAP25596, partial [Drosera capensis]